LYAVAYIAEIYLFTLLEREASLVLYIVLAFSLLLAVIIVILQDWYMSFGTIGTVVLYACYELAQ
jgi:hypothetical protein